MQEALKFLLDSKVFFIATEDGDQPRVRPFGFVMEFDGKLCFVTGKPKPVVKQLESNPKVEISACSAAMEWIRISGKAVFFDSKPAREKAIEIMPMLANVYPGGADCPDMTTFYLTDAEASFCSMTAAPKVVKL